MATKAENFVEAMLAVLHFKIIRPSPAELADLYFELSGRSREEIFVAILEGLGFKKGEVNYQEFNRLFEEKNIVRLAKAAIFPDALQFLKRLVVHRKQLFISSSVPQNELTALVGSRMPMDLTSKIGAILGTSESLSKGTEHVRYIEKLSGASKSEMIAFGDDLRDVELNVSAGIDCVLIDRRGRFGERDVYTAPSFLEIDELI